MKCKSLYEVQARKHGQARYETVKRYRVYRHEIAVAADRLALEPGIEAVRIKATGERPNFRDEIEPYEWTRKVEPDEAEARETLRKRLARTKVLYTTLPYVSRSGMMRHIGVYEIKDGRPRYLSGFAARALGWNLARDEAVEVGGAGMDMGFHLVYALSSVLFGDGYRIRQEWMA